MHMGSQIRLGRDGRDHPNHCPGGRIAAHLLSKKQAEKVEDQLAALGDPQRFAETYHAEGKPVLVYAMGDGNHSLATAKACWEELKPTLSPEEQLTHPARYALVELVNLYDDSLEFEAIHRVLFGVDPKKLFVVSIMPCTAKKAECALPTMKDEQGDQDVDVVLTTREIVRMLRGEQINPAVLPETPFDSPLGTGTGAAVVFGATGGVMDAALRSAYYLITGKEPKPDAFSAVRGMGSWKEAVFTIPGAGNVRVAVVSGLGNTRKLMHAIDEGDVDYDFVEVMACPGGCAGGGGQPIHDGQELAAYRGDILWSIDKSAKVRFSHRNKDVQALYREFLKAPLGEKSHHLLHTDHNGWKMPNEK